MGQIVDSIALLLIGQVVQMTVKHFADRKQIKLLREQNAYLREIAENTRIKYHG
jgi:hypothetical protein